MELWNTKLQKVLQENRVDFIDSLRLCDIDVEQGIWTSDAVNKNAQAGALSLIHFALREEISDQHQKAFLRMIAENLSEEGAFTMSLIYTAYEWDGHFPPYAIIQHMVNPKLFCEYCTALQKHLHLYLQGYYTGIPNIV